jgi:molybdopterin/thiamine biosynthesis adenylyltransferase
MSKYRHEISYRGKEAMTKLANADLVICGAGAIGSNLAVNLVRGGFRKICVVDRDRVEEHNIGTQVYTLDDVGGKKAELLRNLIFRDLGEEINCRPEELSKRNIAKILRKDTVVVDCFDNSVSRELLFEYCGTNFIDCLHLGLNDGYGEIRWNQQYLVPQDGGLDVCEYPLARNLILLIVAAASEVLVNFVLNGQRRNYSITLGDLQINHESDL